MVMTQQKRHAAAAAAVPCSDGPLSLYGLSLSLTCLSLQMGLVVMGLVVVGFDDGGGGGGGGGGAVVVAEVVVAGEKFLWCEVFGLGFVKMFEAKVLSFFLR
ncbi:hypothetical protein HanPI659440_Chr07g0269461 [Helianthus annuus]|nr:hypothetical protein HanPI659440_Chr07g0269461 [Helianthus annuus]